MASSTKYHPLRFAHIRPYAKRVVSAIQHLPGMHHGSPTQDAVQTAVPIVVEGYNQALAGLPLAERQSSAALVGSEISYTLNYAMFCMTGRNIFDIDTALSEMFHHTDVGDIPLSTIQTPFNNLYLHFGAQERLPMFEGEALVEGAYIVLIPGQVLQIYLTTRRVDGKDPKVGKIADRYYYIPIQLDDVELTVSEALQRAIEKEVESKTPTDEAKESFAEFSASFSDEGVEVVSRFEETAETATQEVRDGAGTFVAAMKLVFNSLCYLTAYQDEIEAGWPAATPRDLREKAEHGKTPKERRRATSKLLPLGFTKIRFCRAAQAPDSVDALGFDEKPRRSHWRRGHWRNQALGPRENQTRELRWIRPTYVGKGDAKAISGHLYSVKSTPGEGPEAKDPAGA